MKKCKEKQTACLTCTANRRYFTRFTEEAFAALIGIIFIVEAFKKLISNLMTINFELFVSCHLSFSELSKTYKVHMEYDPEWMSLQDEGCVCRPPPGAGHQCSLEFFIQSNCLHTAAPYGLDEDGVPLQSFEKVTVELGSDSIAADGTILWSNVTMSQCTA